MPATSQAARTKTTRTKTTRAKTTARPQGTTRPQSSARPPSPARSQSPARSARRPRRAEMVHVPLGSLTQREDRPHAACRGCGSGHVTRLSMNLTDGTPVDFTSCHHCEFRTWEHAGSELSVDGILDRTRKVTTQPTA